MGVQAIADQCTLMKPVCKNLVKAAADVDDVCVEIVGALTDMNAGVTRSLPLPPPSPSPSSLCCAAAADVAASCG